MKTISSKCVRTKNICYNRGISHKTLILSFLGIKGEQRMLESKFQSDLIKELKELFPGCIVLKNDANYIQGFPDLLILYTDKWAVLECKKNADERYQPNQEYYLDILSTMSFASTIFPENKEKILYELQQTFRYNWPTRISGR